MKKVVCFITVVILCVALVAGCGRKANLSDRAYECGVAAIEVADAYLDYKITAEEAEDKLDSLVVSVKYIDAEERGTSDNLLEARISGLYTAALMDNPANMKETRNKLAEMVGVGKR